MPAFEATIAALDAANADDPRRIEGEAFECVYARRMSARLAQLYPMASELLKIATRAQHLRRWEIARSAYAEGARGYNEWRRACRAHHAACAGEIMRAHGYGEDAIARVGAIIRKERLKKDADSQALENVAAIVFLEYYLDDFLNKYAEYDDGKLIDILGKTLCKMSPKGHAAALALPLPTRARALIGEALRREADALARLAAVAVD